MCKLSLIHPNRTHTLIVRMHRNVGWWNVSGWISYATVLLVSSYAYKCVKRPALVTFTPVPDACRRQNHFPRSLRPDSAPLLADSSRSIPHRAKAKQTVAFHPHTHTHTPHTHTHRIKVIITCTGDFKCLEKLINSSEMKVESSTDTARL